MPDWVHSTHTCVCERHKEKQMSESKEKQKILLGKNSKRIQVYYLESMKRILAWFSLALKHRIMDDT